MSRGFARLTSALVAAALFANASRATETTALEQLPKWTQQHIATLAKTRAIELSTRLNPFTWRADFDADGAQDFAIFVRETRSKKEGIAFLRRDKAPIVIGAGLDFGNGGDDFSWLDLWSVIEGDGGLPDRLLIAKESSASALVALQNDTAIWTQQGD